MNTTWLHRVLNFAAGRTSCPHCAGQACITQGGDAWFCGRCMITFRLPLTTTPTAEQIAEARAWWRE